MKPLLLHHATLIDGTGAVPLPDAAVLLEDDRLRWAGALPTPHG